MDMTSRNSKVFGKHIGLGLTDLPHAFLRQADKLRKYIIKQICQIPLVRHAEPSKDRYIGLGSVDNIACFCQIDEGLTWKVLFNLRVRIQGKYMTSWRLWKSITFPILFYMSFQYFFVIATSLLLLNIFITAERWSAMILIVCMWWVYIYSLVVYM